MYLIFLKFIENEMRGKTADSIMSTLQMWGNANFIFGSTTAIFNKCEIVSLNEKDINGYIIASLLSINKEYAYVFFNCKMVSDVLRIRYIWIYLGGSMPIYAL